MRWAFAASLAVLVGAGLATGPAGAEPSPSNARRPILIIIAASSPLTGVSLEQARRMFNGDFPEVRPLNLPPGSAERVAVDRVLFGRGPEDMARYWIERKIRGQGGPPRVIPSAHLVARIVARVPGAIGYVVEGPLPDGVRALTIGGLPATHPRYPLFVERRAR